MMDAFDDQMNKYQVEFRLYRSGFGVCR
jgi:hypothetical protein